MLRAKSLTTLRQYSRDQLVGDLTAGIIVGVVALPLAIAFAIASGVSPERGLWTAIIAGFLISALGGSRVQIGGPTGAFIVIVYGIVQQHGQTGLATATVLAGVLLILMGVARLGTVIRFVPHPVVTGFTSGIAVVIASSQVRDAFGLGMPDPPADFVAKWMAYGAHLTNLTPSAVLMCAGTVLILALWPRVTRRLPAPFVALVAATVATHLLALPIETIGGRFGALPTGGPTFTMPDLSLGAIRAVTSAAMTIAILGAVESLLSAVVADGMIGGKHRSNMELVGQGIANVVTPFFGGIPATGAIARTATNVKNGARTPVAGMVHAATLLIITLFFGRYAELVPLAALSGILLVVAYHMSEWRTFLTTLRAPRSDVLVLLATFSLTVLVDLTVAIEVGMVLAALSFVKNMAESTSITSMRDEEEEADLARPNEARPVLPRGVEVFEVRGPLFFGAAEQFKETIGQVAATPRAIVLRMRDVSRLDGTALHVLRVMAHQWRGKRTAFLVAEVHSQPLIAMERAGLLDEIGRDHVFVTLEDALDFARAVERHETPASGVPAVTGQSSR